MSQSRPIALYPGSDINVTHQCSPWIDVYLSPESAQELWIDSNILSHIDIDLSDACFNNISKVYFYDFFHAPECLLDRVLEQILHTAQHYDVVWLTGNAKSIPGISTQRFDFLWNRTKSSTLNIKPGWKNTGNIRAYARSDLHWDLRPCAYLNLNRSTTPHRQRLHSLLREYQGFCSDISAGKILGNRFASDSEIIAGVTIPPDNVFFDHSYISCQVESQYLGTDSVIFTEKTYDHLVRGRIVLNFGPRDFYSCLISDGWRLPQHIDLSWDCESDTETRFRAYLETLRGLLSLPMVDLHQWFLYNREVIEHNYHMLEIKPYSVLDFHDGTHCPAA